MMISKRFGHVQSLIAVVALVVGTFALPTASVASSTPAPSNGIPKLEPTAAMPGLTKAPVVQADARRGELGSIELNVDSVDDEATTTFFTFGVDPPTIQKAAFGNRFTLTNAQAPFQLTGFAAALGTLNDGTGFEAGEMFGVLIWTDPASTGNISNANLVFTGTVTLDQGNVFLGVLLPEPIIVHQGDIYIIIQDLTTDAEDTPIPIVQAENGGSTDPRAFVALNQNTPVDATNPAEYFNFAQTDIVGNALVRGYGELATDDQLVTGGGQTVNAALPGPLDPSALGSSPLTFSWDAPPVQTQPEVEPNNSAGGAQNVEVNKVIQAIVKTSDPGTDIGGGTFEDWFAFTVPAAAEYTIDVVDDGGTDIDIFLYAQNNTNVQIASSANDCGAHEVIGPITLQPGTYVVAVDAFPNPDCAADSNTPYELNIIGPGGIRLTGYNVFCGTTEDFVADAESYIGTVAASQLSLIIQESTIGAFYRVAAVYGDEQSSPSEAVTGTPCVGGPDFATVKVKRGGNGSITLKGGTGDLTGVTLQINGVGFANPPKVKLNKHQVKQKGPLANGQTVGQACPSGCVITIITDTGCSQETAP